MMRDTRRVSKQRRREDALKLEAPRLKIRAGAEEIARGDFTDVDDSELDAFLADLGRPTREHS
jgi:hypothetical protein